MTPSSRAARKVLGDSARKNASDLRECYVYLQMPGTLEVVTCGKFAQQMTASGMVGRFVYGRNYRSRPDAVPIDPFELPVTSREYATTRHDGIFGALRDASPDAWGRLVVQQATGRGDLTELDYLLESPEDRPGALSFGLGKIPPPPVRGYNRVVRLTELLDAAAEIENDDGAASGTDRLRHARILLDQHGTTMGGARPKSVVEDDGALWVAKFPQRGDKWNNAVVEAAMLTLAAKCGIHVPPIRVEQVGERRVLLVQRFDRDAALIDGAHAGYRRHRMVSAPTVLGADESVVDRTRWSYLLLAEQLMRWSHTADADREQLFRRVVYNVLVSNTDDHPRNHALIARDQYWKLAPAYDITPHPTSGQHERRLAMTCGPDGRIARRSNLLAAAADFGLAAEKAATIVNELFAIVQHDWEGEIRRQGGAVRDIEAVAAAILDAGFDYE